MNSIKWLFLLLMVFACAKEEAPGKSLDSVIQVEVREEETGDFPTIVLSCRTEKEYTCSNYSIISRKEAYDKIVKISFLGIDIPEICATAIGPARTNIFLGPLGKGVYEVEIQAGTLKNHGTLEITEQQIRLEFPQQSGIEILTPTVQR